MYRFLGKRVLGDGDEKKFTERNIRVEKLQDMLALYGRRLPPNALGYPQLVEQWIAAATRQSEETQDPRILRERLSLALASEWPAHVLSQRAGETIILSRQGRGDRVPGLWINGGKQAALVVHPDGAKPARPIPAVQDLIAKRASVLLIDTFQTGGAVAPRNRSVKHFEAFNQTDDACRAQDILTALAFLKQSGYSDVKLVGVGKAAVWTLFAAAIAEMRVTLDADIAGFNGTDADFVEKFFVPGIQRAGGLRAARMLVK